MDEETVQRLVSDAVQAEVVQKAAAATTNSADTPPATPTTTTSIIAQAFSFQSTISIKLQVSVVIKH